MKFDLTCDAVSAGFSKFDFSGCESEIKFFGGPFGNRKICIVCGKARDYSCADGAAEVLHLAVDGYGWRENSKRHDLLFQVHPNTFGQIAV